MCNRIICKKYQTYNTLTADLAPFLPFFPIDRCCVGLPPWDGSNPGLDHLLHHPHYNDHLNYTHSKITNTYIHVCMRKVSQYVIMYMYVKFTQHRLYLKEVWAQKQQPKQTKYMYLSSLKDRGWKHTTSLQNGRTSFLCFCCLNGSRNIAISKIWWHFRRLKPRPFRECPWIWCCGKLCQGTYGSYIAKQPPINPITSDNLKQYDFSVCPCGKSKAAYWLSRNSASICGFGGDIRWYRVSLT